MSLAAWTASHRPTTSSWTVYDLDLKASMVRRAFSGDDVGMRAQPFAFLRVNCYIETVLLFSCAKYDV